MAKVAKKLPPPVAGRYRYDWAPLFDGRVWVLEPGVDFDKGVEQFRKHALTAAFRCGFKLKTRVFDGRFYLQAEPRRRQP